ncbi:putative Ig domain-containing protein [Microcoleus sp. FACHB-68]|uniref:putative Ig domain-containing protein n=1 Tax=Microcoleus sp. FACHB-68 TaxID=2692826 RepID=UPI00168229FF|nr:putative Ig domain-containing protein [Microcoleus sp. FACHB-68]MBD1939040.1 VCBS repeat-containing protein [Microcoleus sp. FACHB-68]
MAAFQEQTGSNNPFNGVDVGGSSKPTLGDIDADGDLDAVIGDSTYYNSQGTSDGKIRYYRNDGGTFIELFGTSKPFDVSAVGSSRLAPSVAPTLGDIDSDGDLDAFITVIRPTLLAEQDGTSRYYYRNDSGTFSEQTGSNNPLNNVYVGFSSAPTFADIDNDGDLDAFIGAWDGTIRYYLNDSGTFSEQTGSSNPFDGVDVGNNSKPTFADIDGDGDSDAFIGTSDGIIRYYRNAGGTFSEQTGSNNPLNGVDVGYDSAPTFADIDGDGDSDAFIGERDGTIRYYENVPVSIAAGTSPTEAGTTGTFIVRLSEPAPDGGLTVSYTVGGTASSGTDYNALSGTVSFAAGETVATINVVPIHDTIVDQNETVQVTLTNTTSAAVRVSPNNTATLTIEDNDIEYAIVAGTPTVAEGNIGNTTPITYTITRTGRTDQASSVNFDLAGTATNNADYTLARVSGAGGSSSTPDENIMYFLDGSTTATITLDVLGDVVDEDNETVEISLFSPTAPAGFQATVPVATPARTTITDDDTAGFSITPVGVTLNTNEAGGTATFTLQLDTQPTSDVTIALNSSNTAEGTVTSSVTFNSTNWNTPQTVTITGQDDLNADGEVAYQIITDGAVSSDANYNGLDAPDINVTNTDNDSPGTTITQSDGITSVAPRGVTDSYQIALNTVPTGSVEITVTADAQTQISLDGTTFSNTLTFTRSDLTAQTISVRAVDDSIVSEGTHAGTITHAITNSPDSNYPTTLAINSVNVSLTENTAPTVATPISDTQATAGTLFSYTFPNNTFVDADGNALTYTLTLADGSPLPAWLSFEEQTRTISGTPPEGTAETFDILVTASDTAGASNSERFNLAVSNPTPTPTPNPTPRPTPNPTPAPTATPTATPTPTPGIADLGNLALGIPIIPNINEVESTLTGGESDDTITGTNAAEAIDGFAGDDWLFGSGANDNLIGSDGIDILFGNAGADNIDGGNDIDVIFAGKDNDVVLGQDGDDLLFGEQGNDTVHGSAGNDYINGNANNDTLDGGNGNDTINGGKDNDLLIGNLGADLLLGDIANDTVVGGDGNDYLNGNVGNDLLDGGNGNDTQSGGKDEDILIGNTGDDTLSGDAGNDALYGNAGADLLDGGDGNDSLHGGKDDDTLIGGSGDDILSGDMGNDSLIGGAGNDRFVLKVGAGSDTITDFTDGEDLLGLSAGLTFENLTITAGNNATLILAGDELLASLKGVEAGLITGEDFTSI